MEAIISAENVTFSYPADDGTEPRLTLDGVTLNIARSCISYSLLFVFIQIFSSAQKRDTRGIVRRKFGF